MASPSAAVRVALSTSPWPSPVASFSLHVNGKAPENGWPRYVTFVRREIYDFVALNFGCMLLCYPVSIMGKIICVYDL